MYRYIYKIYDNLNAKYNIVITAHKVLKFSVEVFKIIQLNKNYIVVK